MFPLVVALDQYKMILIGPGGRLKERKGRAIQY